MGKKKKDWGFLVSTQWFFSIIIFCLAFILGVLNIVCFFAFNWWGKYYWWIVLVVSLMTICYFLVAFLIKIF